MRHFLEFWNNFFLIFAPIFRWNQKSCEVENTFSIFKKMFPELQWFNNLCDWLWRPRGSVTAEVRVATGAWTNIQFSIISSSIFWQNCVEDGWNPNWDQSSLLSNEFLIDFHPRIINISQHANTSSDLSYLCKSRFQVKTKDIWLMHGHAKNVPRCSQNIQFLCAPASALPHANYADCAKK